MSSRKSLRVLSHGVVKETMDRQRYIIKGLLPKWGIGMVWGPPQTMKTFFVMDIAIHIAMGLDYQGRKVEQGDVVYCPFEGTHGIVNRLDAFCVGHGLKLVPEQFRVLADPIKFVKGANEGHKLLIHSIREAGIKPSLVVLDTLHQSIVGSENDDEAMGFYLSAAKEIATAFDCFTLIVHHTGKVGTDPRGHSSARGDVDLLLSTQRGGERGTDSDMVTVRVEKMKDGKEGVSVHSWVRVVQIDIDEDGDEITSCYLEPAPPPAGMPSGMRNKGQSAKALAILDKLIAEHGKCTIDQWKNACLSAKLSKGTHHAQLRAFRRSYDELQSKNVIEIDGSLVSIVTEHNNETDE